MWVDEMDPWTILAYPVLMRAATAVQVLQDLQDLFYVLFIFIACFILLVIAPLEIDKCLHTTRGCASV